MPNRGLAAAIVCILLLCTLSKGAEVKESEMSSLAGVAIKLPCVMGPTLCGNVHSMRWYKNDERVFVFSSRAKISRAENSLASRAVLEYSQDSPEAYLVIDKVDLRDEGLYKCDITYVNIHDDCKGINFINFTTLVKPDNITIFDEESIVPDGKYSKVLTEDDDITLSCVAGRGKPVPSVQWWRGDVLLKANFDEEKDEDGVGIGTNKLKIRVSRNDLNVKYECRAYHPALDRYISTHTQLEVNVRPNRLVMSGVEHHVVQGTTVLLKCEVFGARPPAQVKWFNATIELVAEHNSTKFNEGDGTYNTSSTLVFTATRFENDASITCEAANEIMTSRQEVPLRETLKLEVLYPPLVTVVPENHTVNESTDILMFCNYEANPATISEVKWYKDGEELDMDPDHYVGGILDNLPLLIKNSTRDDMGTYTCSLTNDVGMAQSNNSIYVSIHYKPEVNVKLDPPSPFVETAATNSTLTCNVKAGNPPNLTVVRWFFNGTLLHELPDCSNQTFCVDEPNKLFLFNIEREHHGNYSCMGKNAAGWGKRSPPTELVVYYPPSKISLTYHPQRVVKKGSVNLVCSVEEIGRPSNTTFRWTRGQHTVMDVVTANWTIDPVTLETESNFTCTAVNLGGESESATVYIKVDAPPTFIERLPPYYGALYTSQNISISCRVECSPICSIRWMKGGTYLDTASRKRYYVENIVIPPDTRTNDFQSAHSTLYWNMTAWPGGYLDRLTDNANYTCTSTDNAVGGHVKSTTLFAVEYPPENLTLSNRVVNVIEGNIPEKVLCHAKAFPEASYQWRREGEPDVIVKGNALILNHPVSKRNGGNYTCEAYNRHGNNSLTTFINVLYRPECGITKKEVDGKLVLVCTAQANPPEVDFAWKIKNENETVEDNIEKKGMQSILTLETRVENFRTYLCYPNNSVGVTKKPCEVDVSGTVSWWGRLDRDIIMILIAILTGIVLVIVIICIILCIVCRRKQAADKCPNPTENNLTTSPNDALLPNDADKAFYENLPFHNMSNPQNKASRPPSRISSGYGSSRSQKIARPARKFLTVRPLGSKPRNWPQFRSLRLAKAKNTPPVPAPRQFFPRSSLIHHSYQNVPPPKTATSASTSTNDGTDNGGENGSESKPKNQENISARSGDINTEKTTPKTTGSIQCPQQPNLYAQVPSKPMPVAPPVLPTSTSANSGLRPRSLFPPSLLGPKPYPMAHSATSLASTLTSTVPTPTIDTKRYPVSRTPSITSYPITTPKPILTYSTQTVTTPLARRTSNASITAQLLARLSPNSLTTPSTVREPSPSYSRASTLILTRKPQNLPQSSQSEPSSPRNDDSTPSSPRLIKPTTLPMTTLILRKPTIPLRSDSVKESRSGILTSAIPNTPIATSSLKRRNSAIEVPTVERRSKSDSEDPKICKHRMMNGEPSTGSRHSHQQHSHTHHGSRARRKHHRRQQQENMDSLHRYNRPSTGSAPASPPPTQHRCYTSPDSPPSANSYSANPSAPHYSAYTAPRSKADYTFIKFHDVGQEIDV